MRLRSSSRAALKAAILAGWSPPECLTSPGPQHGLGHLGTGTVVGADKQDFLAGHGRDRMGARSSSCQSALTAGRRQSCHWSCPMNVR